MYIYGKYIYISKQSRTWTQPHTGLWGPFLNKIKVDRYEYKCGCVVGGQHSSKTPSVRPSVHRPSVHRPSVHHLAQVTNQKIVNKILSNQNLRLYLYVHLFILVIQSNFFLVIQSNLSMSPKTPGEGVMPVFNIQSKFMNRNIPRVGNLIWVTVFRLVCTLYVFIWEGLIVWPVRAVCFLCTLLNITYQWNPTHELKICWDLVLHLMHFSREPVFVLVWNWYQNNFYSFCVYFFSLFRVSLSPLHLVCSSIPSLPFLYFPPSIILVHFPS